MISFKKIGLNKYQINTQDSKKLKVVFYANNKILKSVTKDLSLQQLVEASRLSNVVSPVIGLPDMHEGFGLPIGGVLATDGLISVGAVGMDINCGVRLLISNLEYNEKDFSQQKLQLLVHQIERLIPTGLGGRHHQKIKLDFKKIVEEGIFYLIKNNFAYPDDAKHTEESGRMTEANYQALSERAKNRAIKELGTLGSGNHFIEIQKIAEIFNIKIAEQWGLKKNQICVMIHSGSRALGHQTCNDFTNLFWKLKDKYKINIPRIGLAALPINSPEGNQYFQAMADCVNFAFANRQMITYYLRQIFKKNFNSPLNLLYDVCHNIAKWENHLQKKLLIHRKGATRALPAKHPQNPKIYWETGHPAIVPGSMGTSSYIMTGLDKNKETYNSINHGAGRIMSRSQAKKTIKKQDFEKQMKKIVFNKPFEIIKDEAPSAYKNITEVIETLVEAGLTQKICRLKPLAVIKGD
jgi:tRNA-splicing ligase RtcB